MARLAQKGVSVLVVLSVCLLFSPAPVALAQVSCEGLEWEPYDELLPGSVNVVSVPAGAVCMRFIPVGLLPLNVFFVDGIPYVSSVDLVVSDPGGISDAMVVSTGSAFVTVGVGFPVVVEETPTPTPDVTSTPTPTEDTAPECEVLSSTLTGGFSAIVWPDASIDYDGNYLGSWVRLVSSSGGTKSLAN